MRISDWSSDVCSSDLDVPADLLQPSEFVTQCPYKGEARYYQITVTGKLHDQIIWYYPEPVHEAARIKGLVCFANEFDACILVDGEIGRESCRERVCRCV